MTLIIIIICIGVASLALNAILIFLYNTIHNQLYDLNSRVISLFDRNEAKVDCLDERLVVEMIALCGHVNHLYQRTNGEKAMIVDSEVKPDNRQ